MEEKPKEKMKSFVLQKPIFSKADFISKLLTGLGTIGGIAITYIVWKFLPEILIVGAFVVLAFSLLLIVIPKFVKASEDKDAKYTKRITMLGLIGLSGLISPLVGFVFALPAFVLSMVALTKNAPHRRRTILITSITTLLCILYVIVGVVINPRNN